MWKYNCVPLLLLGAAFVNSIPVQDYDTGFVNEDNTEDAGAYVGYLTYVGNSDLVSSEELQTLTFIQDPCPVGQMFQSELGICIDYPQGALLPPQARIYDFPASGILLGDDPAVAANQKSESSVVKLTMDDWGTNHGCKSNENYISELDICLPEGSSEILLIPASSEEEIMLSDAPVKVLKQKVPYSSLKTTSSVVKLTKDIWGTNHGCKPGQHYVSELDICYGED